MNGIIINGYKGFIAKNFISKFKSKYKILRYKKDINDIELFKKFIYRKKFTHLIYFAGLSRKKCISCKKECLQTNFLSIKKTIDLLNTLSLKPVFIFISSSHVYGHSKYRLKETSKLKPKDLYSQLKLKSENYIRKNYKNYSILRVFNVYGKDQPLNFFVPDVISKIKNKQKIIINKSIRDFIHISDVTKIIDFIIKKKINRTLNVGSGKGYRLNYIIKKISIQLNIKPNILEKLQSTKIVADITCLKSYGFKFNKNAKHFNIYQ